MTIGKVEAFLGKKMERGLIAPESAKVYDITGN
jgi:hypothetical protein